ncbi:MAG: hypothetical protein RL120_01160 [Gammaproteobacteria bacterium]
MLFKKKDLAGIAAGEITLAFRRWKKPGVKSGGTQQMQLGQLQINKVSPVSLDTITAADARKAGYASLKALQQQLRDSGAGQVYRIEFGAIRADPRVALRDTRPDKAELEQLLGKLAAMDKRASEPWTMSYLRLIRNNEAVRAGDLCVQAGMAKDDFKIRVRRLKNLGLTESLGVGYRLAPRGEAVLRARRK